MTCPKCQRGVSPVDLFCGFCGARLTSGPLPQPARVAAPSEAEPTARAEPAPGGVARRAAAMLVDAAILGVWLFLAWALVLGLSTAGLADWDDPVALLAAMERTEELAPSVAALFAGTALTYLVAFVVLEEATPGKMLFGLRLRRTDGGRLGVGAAIAREALGRTVAVATLGLGFLLAAFGDGRGLHDRIGRTQVVRVS